MVVALSSDAQSICRPDDRRPITSNIYELRNSSAEQKSGIFNAQFYTNCAVLNQTYPYVSVIALDFSKAFDTVRHYTLLEKMARPMLDIPDAVYNWLVDFFSGYSHNTSYGGATSTIKFVSASIIQGAANRLEHSQLRSTKPIVEANRFGILKFT